MENPKCRLFNILLFCVAVFLANIANAQTQITCGNEKTTINDKTTFVDNPKVIYNSVLNGRTIYLPAPEYPPDYLKFTGPVILQVQIDEKGNVASASATAGNEVLRKFALEAVWKTKFKKLLINCKPQKYKGKIVYNFNETNYKLKTENTEQVKPLIGDFEKDLASELAKSWQVATDSLELLNNKGIKFARPICPKGVENCGGFVKILVLLDENQNVVKSEPISGDARLFKSSILAINQPRYLLPDYPKTKTIGIYVCNFDFAKDGNKPAVFNGGVINGKATYLPKPILPPDVNITGIVSVRVTIDETGNVISAEALSGDDILRTFALKAAWKAKFKPTFLSGMPVKVTGAIVVYNFKPKETR